MKTFTKIGAGVFTLIALLHAWRLVKGLEVQVDGVIVPMWVSYIFVIVAAIMAWGLWKESR
jgi:hypothetical protein